MIPILATLKTARFWIKAAPYLLIAAAVIGGILYVRGLEKQVDRIPGLEARIAAVDEARQRDVAGLTTLAAGTSQVAVDSKRDQQILAETVTDAKAPSSPQLRALLDELRKADDIGKPANPTGRASR